MAVSTIKEIKNGDEISVEDNIKRIPEEFVISPENKATAPNIIENKEDCLGDNKLAELL